jgi:hypothetical protein
MPRSIFRKANAKKPKRKAALLSVGRGSGGLARGGRRAYADEIIVDLMVSAGGINYSEAAKNVVVRELGGVPIPFASPRLLWRMKVVTHREKDAGDLVFLRHWFAERGEQPPAV